MTVWFGSMTSAGPATRWPARSASRSHAVDRSPREGADAFRERTDVLAQEPLLGDAAIQRMVWWIHLQERANQMRAAARQRTREFIGSAGHQRGRTVAVAEYVIAAADFDDIGMPGYRPEWIEPFGLDAPQPVMVAKPSEARHQLLLSGIGLGGNDQGTDIVRDFYRLVHCVSLRARAPSADAACWSAARPVRHIELFAD